MAYAPFNLEGKVALVTGGNSGIGLGFARGLASAGADVCIWGTNEEKNRSAANELGGLGVRVLAQQCDVGDQSDVEQSFGKALSKFGRIDACFANAGIGGSGTPFAEMTHEEWRRIFQINMDGVFFTFQQAIRHMTETGEGGSLVVTSSLSAREGAPRSQHYAATKAGVNAMIRGLAVEHARHGIRANSVLPGWIETAMTAGAVANPVFQEKVIKRVPMRRWGTGDDFAGIAVYLASDASSFHTGDSFIIDGGYGIF